MKTDGAAGMLCYNGSMKNYKINQIKEKRILGRTFVKGADDLLPLFWGAGALEINVKASEVWVALSADYDTSEPWVCVEVNGAPVSRFMVTKGSLQTVCIARGLNPQKENLITIIKDTQPMSGEKKHCLLLHEILLDDNGTFCKVPERPLKIEFIGDSITSGEGLAGGVDEMEWIPQWFCASKTFALQTAHALNADWSVVSQCGWGLCWSWDGDFNANIPEHYLEVCSVMQGESQAALGAHEKWEFGDGADFVVLNLGTNDNTGYAIIEEKNPGCAALIVEGTKKFLGVIRQKNPKAKIVWSWGMIPIDKVPSLISAGIEEYKKETGDEAVYTLEYDWIDNGSRGHPGAKTHSAAAQKLIEKLTKLT